MALTLADIGVHAVRWGDPGTVAPWPSAATAGRVHPALDAELRRGAFGAVHAVVVTRHGELEAEHYVRGTDHRFVEALGEIEFTRSTLHDCRSVTKSVVGALVGVAIGAGLIRDVDDPVDRYLHRPAQDITVRQALTMTAGLAWDETTYPYWDERNDENALWRADDPVGFALARSRVAEPGTAFLYNGGLPTVLAAVVEAAAGQSLVEFAREMLFEPLDIRAGEWLRHESGCYLAASGLRLTPLDMARIGELFRLGGQWQGRQLIPASFVEAALQSKVSTEAGGYGYQWWIGDVPEAMGNGGQRIVIDGARGLVIAITAGDYDAPGQHVGPDALVARLRG